MSSANDPLRLEYAEGPNGLRVARQSPPPGAATFSATYIGRAGWAYETPAQGGISRMTTHLLTSGAGRRTGWSSLVSSTGPEGLSWPTATPNRPK